MFAQSPHCYRLSEEFFMSHDIGENLNEKLSTYIIIIIIIELLL
jgi:hypothetical protein